MKQFNLLFKKTEEISIMNLSKFLSEFNSIVCKLDSLDILILMRFKKAEKLEEDEIDYLFNLIYEAKNKSIRFDSPIIKKINYNSPLEIILYGSIGLNVAILLLGGKRTGLNSFEISKGLIQTISDILRKRRRR